MRRERGPAGDRRASSQPEGWHVVLLTRDVSLDEAGAAPLDVPRLRFRGTVSPAWSDAQGQSVRPDLVVLDCTGTEDRGFDLLVRAHQRWPDASVLLLAAPQEADWLARAVRLGVRGALPPGYDHALVRRAVEGIRQGELWFSRRLTQEILSIELEDHRSLLVEHLAESPDLTEPEREVALQAMQGLGTGEIARTLGLAEIEVQGLVRRAYRKLRRNRRSELILRLAMGQRFDGD